MLAEMTATLPPSVSARAPGRLLTTAYVVVAALLVAATTAVGDTQRAAILGGLLGALAVAALVWGAQRTSRVGTNPWLCIGAGLSLWVTGVTVDAFARLDHSPIPWWPQWLAFAGFVALTIGVVVLARVTSDVASRTAVIDALVIGTAMAMVLWMALIAPLHATATMSVARRITLATEPVREGILVGILAWIALAPGRRTRALDFLAIAVALTLAGDLVASADRHLGDDWSGWVRSWHLLAIACFGLAGLYAVRTIREPATGTEPPTEHASRSILIGVALLMGPVAAVVGDLSTVDGMIVIGAFSAVLAIGVVARFVNLVHQNQQAHAATAESERRFRMLADSAPVGIFELQRGLHVTYANAEGSRLLGEEVQGGSLDAMLARVHEESHERFRAALERVADGRSASAELRLAAPSDERWVAWKGVPVAAPGPQLPLAFASTLDITNLKRAEAALERQATHDPLTGLPNRRLLLEALINALDDLGHGVRTGTVALMFVDLDRFKLVNDVLGHDAGDALLRTAATRLRNAVRSHDTVARFGGDEFVVLLQHVVDRGELHDVAQRILDSLTRPIVVAGQAADVGASVGIATATGPNDDPDALIRNADAAMYRAKEHGRGRYEFFRPGIGVDDHRML